MDCEGIVFLVPFLYLIWYPCFSNQPRGAKHERKELGASGTDSVRDDDSHDDSMHHRKGLHFVALFYFVKVLDFSARFSYNRSDD